VLTRRGCITSCAYVLDLPSADAPPRLCWLLAKPVRTC